MADLFLPLLAEITEVRDETPDTRTFRLRLREERDRFSFRPGQFLELSVFGFGEAPFCFASSPTRRDTIEVTVRRTGQLTDALHGLQAEAEVGLRGPCGNGFDLDGAAGRDLLFVGGQRSRGSGERGGIQMRHILSILVENEAGALSRISGLFSARGYNIESLTVAPTEDVTMSRMTVVTVGSDDVIEQITKQLNKLVDVVKVVDLTEGNHIERELMLVKVRAAGKDREEMKRLADIFRGRILDVTDKSYTIELTGTGSKIDAFLQAIEPGVILETVRTGASGIGRGERILRV